MRRQTHGEPKTLALRIARALIGLDEGQLAIVVKALPLQRYRCWYCKEPLRGDRKLTAVCMDRSLDLHNCFVSCSLCRHLQDEDYTFDELLK